MKTMNKNKRVVFASEVCISYKNRVPKENRYTVNSEEDVKLIVKKFHKKDMQVRERVYAAFFNNSNELLGVMEVSSGAITQSIVDFRLIFSMCVKLLATGILIWHNHPSGSIKPSVEDIIMTREIKDICRLMKVVLLDSIIYNDKLESFSILSEIQENEQ